MTKTLSFICKFNLFIYIIYRVKKKLENIKLLFNNMYYFYSFDSFFKLNKASSFNKLFFLERFE